MQGESKSGQGSFVLAALDGSGQDEANCFALSIRGVASFCPSSASWLKEMAKRHSDEQTNGTSQKLHYNEGPNACVRVRMYSSA